MTPDNNLGPFFLPGLYVAPNTLVLCFGDLNARAEHKVVHCTIEGSKATTYNRSASGFLVKSITYDKFLGFGRQGGDKFIVNSILNIDSRSSCAVLAGVIKDTQGGPVRSWQWHYWLAIRFNVLRAEPWSMSADSKIRCGDFPPNSRDTFLRLLFAAASRTLRPVTVEPVKATLSTPLWAANAAPPTGPSEGMVLITPGGKLKTSVRGKSDSKKSCHTQPL